MADLSQLRLLVNLARADGDIADEEITYLKAIARANDISDDNVMELLKANHEEVLSQDMSQDDKLNILIKLIQLMKADGKLYKEEIRYCSKISSKLGYKEEVLFDLMLNVKTGEMDISDILRLKNITSKHLQ